jgi:hypothetical protein
LYLWCSIRGDRDLYSLFSVCIGKTDKRGLAAAASQRQPSHEKLTFVAHLQSRRSPRCLVGQFPDRVELRDTIRRRYVFVVERQTSKVAAFFILQMLKRDRLVAAKLIKGKRTILSFAPRRFLQTSGSSFVLRSP